MAKKGKGKSGGKRGGTRASLKRPDIYDELRKEKHYSKSKAARISNAVAAGTVNHKHGGKSGRALGKKKR
jgi:hypothetical protein